MFIQMYSSTIHSSYVLKIKIRVDMLKLRRMHISKVIYSVSHASKKVYGTRRFDGETLQDPFHILGSSLKVL